MVETFLPPPPPSQLSEIININANSTFNNYLTNMRVHDLWTFAQEIVSAASTSVKKILEKLNGCRDDIMIVGNKYYFTS